VLQAALQLLFSDGTHEPSSSHVPLHVCAEQSGQQSGPTFEPPEMLQQREPAGHPVCEPAGAQAPVARVMHTP
jgi:hypothetical protein